MDGGRRAPGDEGSSLPRPASLVATFAFACLSWSLAGALWPSPDRRPLAVSLFLAGLSVGPCLASYLAVPRVHKRRQRLIVLATGGLSILAFSLLGAVAVDLEGFFMLLFAGTMGVAIGHTLATVIVGPLFFGRLLCGWGCWRAMVLELLPIERRPGRRLGPWQLLPWLGLAVSVGSAAFCVLALGERPGGTLRSFRGESLLPIALTCAVYYVASIGLAFALKDPRAFCKYLCPTGLVLRWTSRPSLVKMSARPGLCGSCEACSRACPMDIPVAELARAGWRVESGECILCQECARACPRGALHLSLGRKGAKPTPLADVLRRPSVACRLSDADHGQAAVAAHV